ncbi:MAG: FecR family protein [Thermoanaerobaculia bacterium]|nr:FecR family protein [Thermoanaerobaculia bacterium]
MRDFDPRPGRSSSPENRPSDDDHETLARLLRLAAPRTPVPEARKQRVEEGVRGHWRRVVAARRRRRWLGAGAGLAAGLVVLVLTLDFVDERGAPGPPPSPVATVERIEGTVTMSVDRKPEVPVSVGSEVPSRALVSTGPEDRVALRLPSGASLRIDRETRLRLPTGDRGRLERGAVYLDTGFGIGDHRSFEVVTPITSVRDVGTQFEVRIVDGGSVRVRVREGSVTLGSEEGKIGAAKGSQILMDRNGRIERATVSSHGRAWSWVTEIAPPHEIEGRPLAEFLDWYSRETGLEVRFVDPELERTAAPIILHGSVEGLPPRQALLAVLPTCGLEHDRAPGAILLRRASA